LNPLSRIIHSITYPDRGLQILDEIRELRKEHGIGSWEPIMIWEPEPVSLSSEERDTAEIV
jgi:hypothetical protein